jgi:hypothetical protein
MSSPDVTLLTRAEIYALGYIPTWLERAGGVRQHQIANHGTGDPHYWRWAAAREYL